MKFNKIVALALALVMVFALCACGGGNTDTKTDDTGSASKVDTNTVSVGAIVIARDDVPTDEIYAFVSTIFDNLDAITAQHAKGAELSIEAAASVKGVPYHPGAAKYFEEKGFKVDAVKEGAGNGTASALSFGTGGRTRITSYTAAVNQLGQQQVTRTRYDHAYYNADTPILNGIGRNDVGIHLSTGLQYLRHWTLKAVMRYGFRDVARNYGVLDVNVHNLAFSFRLGYTF